MNDQDQGVGSDVGLSRRDFLEAGLAAGGGLLVAGTAGLALFPTVADARSDDFWIEKSIAELQAYMASGQVTSRTLTQAYLRRIADLNPTLAAVIETNPQAVGIAAQLDNERRSGHIRGPLHGIPILLKDNIATDDVMQTTAGSLALLRSKVPEDAPIVKQLREAGAVILGKANLSEWANFRGFSPPDFNGWTARGGKTRNPYNLGFDPSGSSTGSAVAVAANLCAAAVGTETDGSIVSPCGNNLVVGLKPSIGLLSQSGIIPIAQSQDTAGPIGRCVADVALMLGAMLTPADGVGRRLPADYTRFLRRGSLRHARIGMDVRYFTPDYGGEPDLVAVAMEGVRAMKALGAEIVEVDTGDPFATGLYDAEFLVLITEFKPQIAEYLGRLRNTRMRSLADLIAFNTANCAKEMPYYGQELFELSDSMSGDLTDPDYLAARALCLELTRAQGIDRVMAEARVEAIISPSYSFGGSQAAIAGYPNLALPVGLTPDNRPAGLMMYASYLQEPRLLAFGFDLEQELRTRLYNPPRYLGTPQPYPPDPGICSAPTRPRAGKGKLRVGRHFGTGKVLRR